MMRKHRSGLIAALLGVAMFFATATPAQAFEFGVKFTVGATSVFIFDGGPGDTAGAGSIQWTGTVDGVNFAITLTTTNTPGTPDVARLELLGLSINNTTSSTKAITIAAAANDYTTGIDQGLLPLMLVGGGAVNQNSGATTTVAYTAYASTTNTATNNDATPPPTDLDFPFGAPTASVSDSVSITAPNTGSIAFTLNNTLLAAFDPSAAYALGGKFDISLSGNGSINFLGGKTEVVVPEPATMVSGLAGLALLGGAYLRRRSKKA
jgi:hypothetical protein